jgi:hypothetical protein
MQFTSDEPIEVAASFEVRTVQHGSKSGIMSSNPARDIRYVGTSLCCIVLYIGADVLPWGNHTRSPITVQGCVLNLNRSEA